MRSLGFVAKLAVIGIATTLAIYALSATHTPTKGMSLQALDNTFTNYLAKHGKSYATKEEYEYRRAIFERTLELVAEQNSNNADEGYFLTVNKFADMTQYELDQSMGAVPPMTSEEGSEWELTQAEAPEGDLLGGPVDWRNIMNPVRDQGQCGSCWAFASIASVEGRWAVKRGEGSIQLSEQQLVDCSAQNNACNGGWPAKAFTFLKVYGAQARDQYPYTAVRGACKYQSSAVVAKVTNIYSIGKMDTALASGPVPVYVQVTNGFRLYGGGIFNGVCGSAINHAVTAVGYGVENGNTYYIIRNSWGTGWGEAGHIRVLANGKCGIYKNVFPSVN